MLRIRKASLFLALVSALITSFAVIPTSSAGTVAWVAEDVITKGNWYFAPIGSPMGTYGSCAHFLPNAPQTDLETPIGEFSVPIGGFDALGDPPYSWAVNQILGLPYHRLNPLYYDEYATRSPPVITYHINGTRYFPPEGGQIQYPAFEYAWEDWHTTQTEPREVYYAMETPGTGNGPGWRLASWDDGGERCQPLHGYMNFTLTFPEGDYLLSLYAYDYERDTRFSQQYRIYDSTGTTLLASKGISGTVFDEGVYEIFSVSAPEEGLTIVLQVYNDAGHVGEPFPSDKTNNVVLSGIFIDCVVPRVGGEFAAIDSSALAKPEPLLARAIWAALPVIAIPLLTLLGIEMLKKRRLVQAH